MKQIHLELQYLYQQFNVVVKNGQYRSFNIFIYIYLFYTMNSCHVINKMAIVGSQRAYRSRIIKNSDITLRNL